MRTTGEVNSWGMGLPSAFAASICPNERYDFAGLYFQIAIRQCEHATVTLDNITGRKRHIHRLFTEIGGQDFLITHDAVQQKQTAAVEPEHDGPRARHDEGADGSEEEPVH